MDDEWRSDWWIGCGSRLILGFSFGVSFIRLVIQLALQIRKAAL